MKTKLIIIDASALMVDDYGKCVDDEEGDGGTETGTGNDTTGIDSALLVLLMVLLGLSQY